MERYFITHCSKEKSLIEKPVSAIKRYLAPHVEYVFKLARLENAGFLIFSGKYGFLEADAKIPYYDKLLTRGDFDALGRTVDAQYKKYGFESAVFYHTDERKDPKVMVYIDFITAFARRAGVDMEFARVPETG